MTDPMTTNPLTADPVTLTDEQRQQKVALLIYRRMVGPMTATFDDARRDLRHWTNLWLVSGAVIGAAIDGQYKVAHEHGDDDEAFGCPIYQHTCGHVAPLSLMEAVDPGTGRDCDGCHQHPEASAWHVLFRKNKKPDS